MIELGTAAAKSEGFAKQGDQVVIIAGLPFGQSGTTNLLHIAKVE
ncbi:MAG TPA: pyruvate kinase alpha/beta domain-containing protein [Rhodocyclaceae bacterium]|nr:pyruvate kinase alpha/beta domain-containing protein [Rhodocyclaceae bacterium]HWV19101.1 pyruvate kinase alpha/beta domain-containing protein [Rhodocyclaceae bacterium]